MSNYSPEIAKLISEGSRAYSSKDFELASEKYGEACEEYSKTHQGNEDADLLFLYGKAVFQSGVSKSEVFGGKPAEQDLENENSESKEEDSKPETDKTDDTFQFYADGDGDEEDGDANVFQEQGEEKDEPNEDENNDDDANKSDFEVAWELLDLARALFEEKLESLDKGDLKPPYLAQDTEESNNDYVVALKKLSETYDILGEVSLEAENFNQAAEDLRKCLDLRLELFSDSSSLISESHYKLALALEFQSDDSSSRKNAAEQMKLAIESVERRNQTEKDDSRKKDNQEIIDEMREKYQDLLKDPSEEIKKQQLDIIKGILGEEASGSEQSAGAAIVNNLQTMVKKKQKPEETKPVVNDLSGMVRKRKKQDSNDDKTKKPKSE
ncbi:histone binding protein, putative [Candida dubliniensis CD36]|uniref:Histone binding protein, putative n=1 Tax=Candida dubliniensis (strain CD36 / ATCC MYA-646 / CBS 7987 / NCPF 3949 / NRRL Y-17841) TaxID=573826 RepID=B9W7M2_CANDC|nr:histone binding protein, putative [Candida dubliniensis CD36]CAX44683.1 histone binding protein, putative [Candida dubliniensis CD36]